MHPVTPAGMLAGRANELSLLDGLFNDLARGGGNAVLIEGEPGIGKTSLVRSALATAARAARNGQRAGCQEFWGAGDELGQELPLLPFLDALRVRGASANARRATIAGLLRGEVATDRGADVPAMLAEQLIALAIRRDRRPAGSARHRRPAVGRCRLRQALGPSRAHRAAGSAAAHRHDQARTTAGGPARVAPGG